MLIDWKERLKQNSNLCDIENWPHIDIKNLSLEHRKIFLSNKKIIEFGIQQNHRLAEIADLCGTTKSKVSKLLKRCLGGDEDSEPALSAGLIPYYRCNQGKRKKDLPTIMNPSGASFSFSFVMDSNPLLRKDLDEAIWADITDKKYKQNLTAHWLHEIFINYLEKNDWPRTTYPFNEPRLGYEALRRYYNNRKNELLLERTESMLPKRRISSATMSTAYFEEIQIDEQRYDLHSSVHIELGGLLEPISLSRVSLVLAKDVATSATLGYSLALTASPTRDDILDCLQSIHKTWKPMELKTPGLEYMPESGFPSNIFPESRLLCPGEFKLDNAYCHIAHLVREYVTNEESCTFNLGIPRNPKGRNWIEYAFKLANEYSHRFCSTTGSNVVDPKRQSRKNSKQPPLVTLRTLEECLDIVLAANNAKPKKYLGQNSPLGLIKYQLENVYLPTHSLETLERLTNTNQSEIVSVRWDKWNRSTPHVNFLGVKYKGIGLDSDHIGKKIRVVFFRNDIRTLKAFSLTGTLLGELICPKSWQRFQHSIKTRKLINNYVDSEKRQIRDPISSYFNFLIKNRKLPTMALELVRFNREVGGHDSTNEIPPHSNESASENPTSLATSRPSCDEEFPEWSPSLSGIGNEK